MHREARTFGDKLAWGLVRLARFVLTAQLLCGIITKIACQIGGDLILFRGISISLFLPNMI